MDTILFNQIVLGFLRRELDQIHVRHRDDHLARLAVVEYATAMLKYIRESSTGMATKEIDNWNEAQRLLKLIKGDGIDLDDE